MTQTPDGTRTDRPDARLKDLLMSQPHDPHHGYDPSASGAPGYPLPPQPDEGERDPAPRQSPDPHPHPHPPDREGGEGGEGGQGGEGGEGHYPPPGGWSTGDDLPPRPPQGRTNTLVLWILGLIVILIVAIAAYYTLSESGSKSSAPSPVDQVTTYLAGWTPA
jgi:hypothetical protein